jgi:hypothetical protein
MTGRRRLPNRRANEIVDFEHDGQRYTAAISRFPNGGPIGRALSLFAGCPR